MGMKACGAWSHEVTLYRLCPRLLKGSGLLA